MLHSLEPKRKSIFIKMMDKWGKQWAGKANFHFHISLSLDFFWIYESISKIKNQSKLPLPFKYKCLVCAMTWEYIKTSLRRLPHSQCWQSLSVNSWTWTHICDWIKLWFSWTWAYTSGWIKCMTEGFWRTIIQKEFGQ